MWSSSCQRKARIKRASLKTIYPTTEIELLWNCWKSAGKSLKLQNVDTTSCWQRQTYMLFITQFLSRRGKNIGTSSVQLYLEIPIEPTFAFAFPRLSSYDSWPVRRSHMVCDPKLWDVHTYNPRNLKPPRSRTQAFLLLHMFFNLSTDASDRRSSFDCAAESKSTAYSFPMVRHRSFCIRIDIAQPLPDEHERWISIPNFHHFGTIDCRAWKYSNHPAWYNVLR